LAKGEAWVGKVGRGRGLELNGGESGIRQWLNLKGKNGGNLKIKGRKRGLKKPRSKKKRKKI